MRKSQSSLQLSTLLLKKKKNLSISPLERLSEHFLSIIAVEMKIIVDHSFQYFSCRREASKRKKRDDNVGAWCTWTICWPRERELLCK